MCQLEVTALCGLMNDRSILMRLLWPQSCGHKFRTKAGKEKSLQLVSLAFIASPMYEGK